MAYLFGFDIETGGPVVDKHPLLAVGFCIYHWDLNEELILMDICEVHLAGKEEDYDPDTLKWWSQQATWETVKSDTIEPALAAERLIAFIKGWQTKAHDEGKDFYTITDNCWFDDTWLSPFLCRHGGLPMRYSYINSFTRPRFAADISQYIFALRLFGIDIPEIPGGDHTPVADAKCIVQQYVQICKTAKAFKPLIKPAIKPAIKPPQPPKPPAS